MLSYEQILRLHDAALREHGGNPGILSEHAILSALNQPLQTFGGVDLYPGPIAKSAALGYFLTKAHGFGDGNKRVGYMAMKVALLGSGYHLTCSPDEGEFIILAVAEGEANLKDLTTWVANHIETAQPNAAEEILATSPQLFGSMRRLRKLQDVFQDRMAAHQREIDGLVTVPKSHTDRRLSKIFRAVASDVRAHSSNLREEVLTMSESSRIMESHGADLARWLDVYSPEGKKTAFDIMIKLGASLEASYDAIEAIESSQKEVEKGRHYSPEMDAPCAELIAVLEDEKVVFNQCWFSLRDMVESLKKRLM